MKIKAFPSYQTPQLMFLQVCCISILAQISEYKRNIIQICMIKSSFKKVQKTTPSQKCFFGHPQLDAIFNNSLSKGHLMILQEDHPSTNYLSLLRYFVSHQYHQKLTTLVYDIGNKWKFLVSPALKKEEKEVKKMGDGGKSEIAWRYDKMNIKLNNLAIDERINFIDLSRQVTNYDQNLVKICQYPNATPIQIYKHIEQNYINAQVDQKDTTTKKLLLTSLPSYLYRHQQFSQFLQALRCLTRSSNVFTLITVPHIISKVVKDKLVKYSDYFIEVSKLGKGYEDFTGSLTIVKEVECAALRTCLRGPSVWGLKGGRKQLRIESLYEQPFQNQSAENKHNDF